MSENSQELLKETVFRLLGCNQQQHEVFKEGTSSTVLIPGTMDNPVQSSRYSLRVKMKQPKTAGKTCQPKKSPKDYYRNYRMRLQREPLQYEEYKKKDSIKKKLYRKSLTGEKRICYNENAKMRMRAYRQRLKEKGSTEKPSTRQKIAKMRDYWREKKREERARLSVEHKHLVNEKRRTRYRMKCKKKLFNESGNQTPKKEPCSRYLPKKTEKFVDTISKALQSATPRKMKALASKGLIASKEEKLKHETNSKIVARVKSALNTLKRQQTKEGRQRYRLLTCSLVGKYAVEHKLRQALGLKWEYWLRMSALERNEDELVKRSDAFSEKTVKSIQTFYEYESVSLPTKKTVNGKTLKQKSVLTDTIQQVHKRFLQDNPDLKVSLSHFRKLRPKEVLTVNQQKFASCLCEYCLNVQFKIDSLNQFLKTYKVDNRIESKYHAVDITLCDKGSRKFHQRKCVERKCQDCGTKNFETFIKPLADADSGTVYTWKRWELGTVGAAGGKEVKRQILVERRGELASLMKEFLKEVDFLANHLFIARWQYNQFNELSKSVPERNVVTIADFSENYRCVHQDEIQSAYYNYSQATLFPMIAYYRCPDCKESIVQESAVFISPDLNHDALAVDQFSKMMADHIKGHVNITKEIQFSDGCASQFKSKHTFLHVSETKTHTFERAYFGSRHGKSPCDALGGIVKKAAELHVKSRKGFIQNAQALFEFCKDYLTMQSGGRCEHKRRVFFYKEEIKREKCTDQLQTLKGTRQLHSVLRVKPGVIKYRHLSCFCNKCLAEEESCLNEEYVGEWQTHNLIKDTEQKKKKESVGREKKKKETGSKEEKKKETGSKEEKKKETGSKEKKKETESKEEKKKKETGSKEEKKKETGSKEEKKKETGSKEEKKKETGSKEKKKKETGSKEKKKKETESKENTQICDCSSMVQLKRVLADKNFAALPQQTQKTFRITGKSVDKNSMALVPNDIPLIKDELHPAAIFGDGNCLPRCASVLAYGDEESHQEMRERIVCELVKRSELYLDNQNLRKGMNPLGLPDVAKTFASYSEMYTGTRLNKQNTRKLFDQEVLYVCKNGKYMGLWQLASLANVLSCPVVSVCPTYGSYTVRNDMHRVFYPFEDKDCNKEPVYIMWTNINGKNTSEKDFVVNHFVVLMPITGTSEINIDSFEIHETNSEDYHEDDGLNDSIWTILNDLDFAISDNSDQCASQQPGRKLEATKQPAPVSSAPDNPQSPEQPNPELEATEQPAPKSSAPGNPQSPELEATEQPAPGNPQSPELESTKKPAPGNPQSPEQPHPELETTEQPEQPNPELEVTEQSAPKSAAPGSAQSPEQPNPELEATEQPAPGNPQSPEQSNTVLKVTEQPASGNPQSQEQTNPELEATEQPSPKSPELEATEQPAPGNPQYPELRKPELEATEQPAPCNAQYPEQLNPEPEATEQPAPGNPQSPEQPNTELEATEQPAPKFSAPGNAQSPEQPNTELEATEQPSPKSPELEATEQPAPGNPQSPEQRKPELEATEQPAPCNAQSPEQLNPELEATEQPAPGNPQCPEQPNTELEATEQPAQKFSAPGNAQSPEQPNTELEAAEQPAQKFSAPGNPQSPEQPNTELEATEQPAPKFSAPGNAQSPEQPNTELEAAEQPAQKFSAPGNPQSPEQPNTELEATEQPAQKFSAPGNAQSPEQPNTELEATEQPSPKSPELEATEQPAPGNPQSPEQPNTELEATEQPAPGNPQCPEQPNTELEATEQPAPKFSAPGNAQSPEQPNTELEAAEQPAQKFSAPGNPQSPEQPNTELEATEQPAQKFSAPGNAQSPEQPNTELEATEQPSPKSPELEATEQPAPGNPQSPEQLKPELEATEQSAPCNAQSPEQLNPELEATEQPAPGNPQCPEQLNTELEATEQPAQKFSAPGNAQSPEQPNTELEAAEQPAQKFSAPGNPQSPEQPNTELEATEQPAPKFSAPGNAQSPEQPNTELEAAEQPAQTFSAPGNPQSPEQPNTELEATEQPAQKLSTPGNAQSPEQPNPELEATEQPSPKSPELEATEQPAPGNPQCPEQPNTELEATEQPAQKLSTPGNAQSPEQPNPELEATEQPAPKSSAPGNAQSPKQPNPELEATELPAPKSSAPGNAQSPDLEATVQPAPGNPQSPEYLNPGLEVTEQPVPGNPQSPEQPVPELEATEQPASELETTEHPTHRIRSAAMLETDADNINDMGTITLESEPINVGDYLLLEYRAKKKSLQYVGELTSLKNINGEENTKTLSDITEFGYLPLLNGNSNEASGGKYGIDECVKRLINLSETGHKLTSVQKDELGTITNILNTIKSKGCFHVSNLTQTLITECPCHLEVWASLHKHGIVPLRYIIQMNQKNGDFVSNFTKQILDFLKDSGGTDFIPDILSELINIGYVTLGESDKARDCTKTSISVLDCLIKDILHCILKNDNTNMTTSVKALCSLSVPVQVQKSFYSHVFSLIMGYKPEMKVSKAIREQCKWVYGKISESLIMLYKQILLVLDVPEIMSFVLQILEQHEVNWQLFLSFISVETVFILESQKHLLDFTDNLLQEGLEDCDMETTITAMLITRQACFQGPHVFMSYADWFQRTFSDSSRSFANSRKSFTFLMKLLTDLAPYESAQHIKVHILRPPFVPGKCRQVLTDYIMLAKTRLQDLQEPLDAQNNGESKEQNSTSDLFAGEVSSAVEAFHTSGKIPTSILEASIFRKPYYIGQFLPVLLKPRPLPDMPDDKMKLIAALKKADKIPPNLYKSYEKECKKEAMQLIEGVFVDLDSDDDMELSPLEQLENSLQHLFALVNPGDLTVQKPKHTLKEVVSVIASKVEVCLHDIPVNPIAQVPVEINIKDSSMPSNFIQVVDMILNRVSLALKSVYSAGSFDCLWLTKLIEALVPYNKFTESLFKRIFILLVKQGCSLSEYHVDTLAAILVEIHLLKDQTPSIIPCDCQTGSDSLLEYVAHHMSIQSGNHMLAALRFVCSCLKYVYSSHKEETGFSNVPCLMKKFIYLSLRLVPECRHGDSESEQGQDGSDLQDIVLLLYQSKFVKTLAQNAQFHFKEWLEYELQIQVREDHLTDFGRYGYYQWIIYQYYMMKTGIGYESYREAASIMIKVMLTFDNKACSACVKSNGVQLTNVGRGAVIGLVQQISDLTQLFKETESENDVLPWLPQQLMNLIESIDDDITKQNMVLNFTRLCLSLPPYLMFSDTSRNLASVTKQLKGSLNVINSIFVTYLSEGALLPVSFTVYIAQGLLQAMKSSRYESGMKGIMKSCPPLMMAFVVHYKAVSPFVDILMEDNRSELRKFFTDLREDSYCVTENHWLCSCSIFSQILFSASRQNFQEIYKDTVIHQSIIAKVTELLFIQSTYLQYFSQIKNKSQLTRVQSALTTILDDRLEVGILDHVLQGKLDDRTRRCTNHHMMKLYPVTVLRFLKDGDMTNIGGHLNTEGLNGLFQSYVSLCKLFEEGSKNSKVVASGDISQISEFLVNVIENIPADLLRSVNQDILMESGPLIYDAVLHQI